MQRTDRETCGVYAWLQTRIRCRARRRLGSGCSVLISVLRTDGKQEGSPPRNHGNMLLYQTTGVLSCS